jgi:type III secretory pathway component EscU
VTADRTVSIALGALVHPLIVAALALTVAVGTVIVGVVFVEDGMDLVTLSIEQTQAPLGLALQRIRTKALFRTIHAVGIRVVCVADNIGCVSHLTVLY